MKRILALAALLLAAVLMTACGGAQKTPTETAAAGEACGADCKKKGCKKPHRKKGDCKGKKGCDKPKGDCKGKKGDCKGKDCADDGKPGFTMLPAAELLKQIDAKAAMTIFDVNRKERFLKGHVPGAVHVNRRALTHMELGKDKAAKLVFYCGSPKCRASHKAAHTARHMGYTNVFVMPEGIKGWEAAGLRTVAGGTAQVFSVISAKDLQVKSQGAPQVHIFDVNSPERFAKGHVPGARNASAADLSKAGLPKNKGAMVVFYCGSRRCAASHRAAYAAAKLGYTQVYVMAAGIKGWEADGLKTDK